MADTFLSSNLSGVILGFVLGFLGTFIRDRLNERKQKQRVRLLISLEIDDNISELKHYRDTVIPDESNLPDSSVDYKLMIIANRVVRHPMPPWNHTAWNSQISLIAVALTTKEIRDTQQVYSGLSKLVSIRDQLRTLTEEDVADRRAGERGGRMSSGSFVMGAEIVSVIDRLLEAGNPLSHSRKPGFSGKLLHCL